MTGKKAPPEGRVDRRFPVVGIGASAGGLSAFRELIDHLPADTGMAFVLVPHLDPTHESLMSEILSRRTAMPVREVSEDETVMETDHVYVIKPNTFLTISDGTLRITPREGRKPRECIDHFLVSLAGAHRDKAVGVVLSGTGSDGTEGLRAIRAAGGVTFVQDASAQFPEMPRNAAATGVDFVLPPREIAEEIARIARHPFAAIRTLDVPGPEDEGVRKILRVLRGATGVDFELYKQTTVRRRVARRMALLRLESLEDFLKVLENSPAEVKALHDDILINVTSFFREPEIFEALRERVLPEFLKDRSPKDSIRVWVPGCSTGEEVYSLAIVILEFLAEMKSSVPSQFFGTDVSELALEKARKGIFDATSLAEVSPDRLRRCFSSVDKGKYQISKAIRDLCVFAKQDVTRDPPFSRLDLLSCRNVLIYLGGPLQKRIFPVFHYALKSTGVLVLGASESVGTFTHLFAPLDKNHRIYTKLPAARPSHMDHFVADAFRAPAAPGERGAEESAVFDVQKEADRVLLAQYVPAGIVVDDRGQVVYVRGETGAYLRPGPGKPSFNLLRMAREELVAEVEAALREAKETLKRVRKTGVRLRSEGREREIAIEVTPLRQPASSECYFLIFFQEGPAPAPGEAAPVPPSAEGRGEPERVLRELATLREYHQGVVEKYEAANEELRSAHEEVLSANEELQSTNEEMETAKEELQSANEELTTLNDELRSRNVELGEVNSDLNNLITSVNIPVAFVDAGLRLRRFSPAAEKFFNIIPADVNRRITDFKAVIDLPDLEALLHQVLDTLVPAEKEVRDPLGRWYSLVARPYRTLDNKIDGALLLLLDIDAQKKVQAGIEAERALLGSVVDTIRDPFVVMDAELRVRRANESFLRDFRVSREETEGRLIYDLGNRQWDIPGLRRILEEILPKDSRFKDFPVELDFPKIGRRSFLLHGRRVQGEGGSRQLILLTFEDATERLRAAALFENTNRELDQRVKDRTADLEAAMRELEAFSYSVSHDLRAPLRSMSSFSYLTLQEYAGKILDAQGQDYLRLISEAAGRMDALISNLLDYSRMGRMGITLEPVDLEELVAEVLEGMAQEIEEKKAEVRVEKPLPRARGHRVLLVQALTNLVSNAIKFLPRGTRPRVRVGAEAREGRVVRLWVEDNGIGIAPGDLGRIFGVFQRLHRREEYPGTGIGLAIVKRAVERMGGKVGVESRPDKGSRFWIDLEATP